MKKLLVVIIAVVTMAGNAWAGKSGADSADFAPVNEAFTQRLLELAEQAYRLMPGDDGRLKTCVQLNGSLTGVVSGAGYYDLSICETSMNGTVSYDNYSNEAGIVIYGSLDLALAYDDFYLPRYLTISLNGGPLTAVVYGQSYTVSMQNLVIVVDAYTGYITASGTYVVDGQPFTADATVAGLLF